jgi:hypothetical protein
VTDDAAAATPFGELGSDGTVEDRVRDVVETLTARPTRDPASGRFVAGSLAGAASTLAHSRHLLDALGTVKREVVARVLADRGGEAGVSETLLGLVDAYAEARLLRQSMWVQLNEQGGPITGKGKRRALLGAYLNAVDREMKLAQVVGLERSTKRVDLARALSGMDPT